jgi:hypothetical protein
MLHVAKVMDDFQASFNLLVAHLSPRNQRAILGVNVGPVDTKGACPLGAKTVLEKVRPSLVLIVTVAPCRYCSTSWVGSVPTWTLSMS